MNVKSIRRALTGLLLSLGVPGLGQIYNGQLAKGVLSFGLLAILLVVSTVLELVHNFPGFLAYLILFVGAQLLLAADAAWTAFRQTNQNARPVRTWKSYLIGVLLLANVILAVGTRMLPNGFPGSHAYKITAESMAPTLRPGDRIMVDPQYFSVRAPQRGELVAFRVPSADSLDVKRVVALGGDVVSLRGPDLQVNGKTVSEPYARYEPIGDDIGAQQFPSDFAPIRVPAGHFFVLGDNRNHSYDSRYFGAVALRAIVAKPLYVYWSEDRSTLGQELH
jgi:signal peptidase I